MHGRATILHFLPMVRQALERVGPLWAMASIEVGSVHVCVCVCVSVCACLSMYLDVCDCVCIHEREREREREC